MISADTITMAIIAINVIFSFKGFNDTSFFDKYKFNVGGIHRGEKARMLTSGFLHVDMGHLLFNMLTLYFFAGAVIYRLGMIKFLLIYVVSLLAGSFLSFFFNKEKHYYNAVGASGAVMGILYAAILLDPQGKLYLYFSIPMYKWLFGIGYLLYSIYGMKKRTDNIGHDAHFGGAVAGYILTLIFIPTLFQEQTLFVVLLAIPIIVLFVMYKLGKI